jgi:hypothetical protein
MIPWTFKSMHCLVLLYDINARQSFERVEWNVRELYKLQSREGYQLERAFIVGALSLWSLSCANNSPLTRVNRRHAHAHAPPHHRTRTHTAIVGINNEDKEREVTPEEGRTLAAKLHADLWTEIPTSPRADSSFPLLHAPHTRTTAQRTRTRTPHTHTHHAHAPPHNTRRRLSCPVAEEKENLRLRLAAAVLPVLRPMAGDTWVKPTAAELNEMVVVPAAVPATPAATAADASDKREARCLVQ